MAPCWPGSWRGRGISSVNEETSQELGSKDRPASGHRICVREWASRSGLAAPSVPCGRTSPQPSCSHGCDVSEAWAAHDRQVMHPI